MIEFNHYDSTLEDLGKRAQEIFKLNVNKTDYSDMLKTILGCIDLTSLEGTDTNEKIFSMCRSAQSFAVPEKGIPNVAAVCFYSVFTNIAKSQLKDSDIKVAAVAGGFPGGLVPVEIKEAEVKYAVKEGADEVDVVISRGLVLANKCREAFEQIIVMKEAAGSARLKVILETGELETVYKIRRASELAINGGADMIKTSTGKIKTGATYEAVLIMLDSIKEYFEKTGEMVGIKASGGISEPEEAVKYYLLVQHVLGEKWLNKNYFRIGASRLASKIADILNE
ncbi:MAG: deoxyribose-phosphate aldolase [Bacteroidales bacterium]|nr:deoxyribose-phosphate aldolase [Bacteroidales bacterium]